MKKKESVFRKKEDRRPYVVFKLILIVWALIFIVALARRIYQMIR